VAYDRDRIATAIFKAATTVGGTDRKLAEELAVAVEKRLVETYGPYSMPTVEDIQDVVEEVLIKQGHVKPPAPTSSTATTAPRPATTAQDKFEATDNIPYKKIYEVLRWNMDHELRNGRRPERDHRRGRYPELVRACDERYSTKSRGRREDHRAAPRGAHRHHRRPLLLRQDHHHHQDERGPEGARAWSWWPSTWTTTSSTWRCIPRTSSATTTTRRPRPSTWN
jgi:hypothetical protein